MAERSASHDTGCWFSRAPDNHGRFRGDARHIGGAGASNVDHVIRFRSSVKSSKFQTDPLPEFGETFNDFIGDAPPTAPNIRQVGGGDTKVAGHLPQTTFVLITKRSNAIRQHLFSKCNASGGICAPFLHIRRHLSDLFCGHGCNVSKHWCIFATDECRNRGKRQEALMQIKHAVKEESISIRRRETWTFEVDGYEVLICRQQDGTVELSIYHQGEPKGIRLGLLVMYPKSVDAIEKLGADAPALFSGIGQAIRSLGMEDLRSPTEKLFDEMNEQILTGGAGRGA
jgi:hypothetical protein